MCVQRVDCSRSFHWQNLQFSTYLPIQSSEPYHPSYLHPRTQHQIQTTIQWSSPFHFETFRFIYYPGIIQSLIFLTFSRENTHSRMNRIFVFLVGIVWIKLTLNGPIHLPLNREHSAIGKQYDFDENLVGNETIFDWWWGGWWQNESWIEEMNHSIDTSSQPDAGHSVFKTAPSLLRWP